MLEIKEKTFACWEIPPEAHGRTLDTMRRSFDNDLNLEVGMVLIGRNRATNKIIRGVIWSQVSRKAVSRQVQSVLATIQHQQNSLSNLRSSSASICQSQMSSEAVHTSGTRTEGIASTRSISFDEDRTSQQIPSAGPWQPLTH